MLKWFTDSGHGWLRVPVSEILRLGLQYKISEYSYIHDGHVYLEEDCDAGEYLEAAGLTREQKRIIPKRYDDDSPVRSYNGFTMSHLRNV